MNNKEMLSSLISLGKGISVMFGKDCEVIIHDIKNKGIVVAIYNGHVTGRKEGDSLNLLGRYKIEEVREGKDFYNCLYSDFNGKLIKSTTIHFKCKDYHYALGINYDFSKLSLAKNILDGLLETGIEVEKVVNESPTEKIINDILEEGLKVIGKPVSLLNKNDRVELVKFIDKNGGFSMRRGVQTVAEKINISKYSIYNYLKEFEKDKN